MLCRPDTLAATEIGIGRRSSGVQGMCDQADTLGWRSWRDLTDLA